MNLEQKLLKELVEILGLPIKAYRETKNSNYEYIIFSRGFGKNMRLDLAIATELYDDPWAIKILLAQLPEQLMDWYERNTEFGSAWWPLKRSEYPESVGSNKGAKLYIYQDGREEVIEYG